MEECYLPAKLKRKDPEQVTDDFWLPSPATKIRRLDTELPPIIEEDEITNPVVFQQPEPSESLDDRTGIFLVNEERAIVLYDPINTAPLLQSRSPFSISVNPDFLSGFKNPVLWSNRSHILDSLTGVNQKHEDSDHSDEQNNGSLAVVPWMPPMHSQHQSMAEQVSEMMDADDMEAVTMDIEEDNNSQRVPINEFSEFGSVSGCEGVNQWQQHCLVPQAAHSLSAPMAWSGTGV